MTSNGLDLSKCRSITIDNCDFSYPQYEGGGGNGYGMNICAQESLIKDCSSTSARHSYSFKYSYANGNVIYHYTSNNPKYGSDFHMYLSMSNLIDNQELNGDFVEANIRPYGATAGNRHGYTSTQTVFWNAKGNYYKSGSNYIIDSRQFGSGYIIGTQGAATAVKTTPTTMVSAYGSVNTALEDFKEGIGKGAALYPQSLYYDQLDKRLNGGSSTEAPTETITTQQPTSEPADESLLSQNKTVIRSGSENDTLIAGNAVDGKMETRWSSNYSDDAWLTVDLGKIYSVSKVVLNWEAAYASAYKIQTSKDGSDWTTVKNLTGQDGGTDTVEFDAADARYVRMQGVTRALPYGYSLWEFQVYGRNAASGLVVSFDINIAKGCNTTHSGTESDDMSSENAVDGNTGTRWSSNFADNAWITVDLGKIYLVSKVVLNWEAAYASAYKIQTSKDGSNWTTVKDLTGQDGGKDIVEFDAVDARYVRMQGGTRALPYGYSLWEFEVYSNGTAAAETKVTSSTSVDSPSNPIEVFGVVVSPGSTGEIGVVWGQSTEQLNLQQKYNVYIDGVKKLSQVPCAWYSISGISAGKHTVKVTAVLGAKETDGVINSVTVK